MTYVAPATPSPGDVLTAAFWDTHVRDRILQTPEALASAAAQNVFSTGANAIAMVTGSKYKTADQSVNNSTTLVNDTHLAWAVAASEVWAFRFVGYFTAGAGDPSFKFAFTVPAASTGWRITHLKGSSIDLLSVADLTTAQGQATVGSITQLSVVCQGVYIGGANAGTVQLQWAQQAAVAVNTTLKAGSYLDLKRLA